MAFCFFKGMGHLSRRHFALEQTNKRNSIYCVMCFWKEREQQENRWSELGQVRSSIIGRLRQKNKGEGEMQFLVTDFPLFLFHCLSLSAMMPVFSWVQAWFKLIWNSWICCDLWKVFVAQGYSFASKRSQFSPWSLLFKETWGGGDSARRGAVTVGKHPTGALNFPRDWFYTAFSKGFHHALWFSEGKIIKTPPIGGVGTLKNHRHTKG